jgi:hypothetical protein
VYLWAPLGTNGYQWMHMGPHGYPWAHMGTQGYPWAPPWVTRGIHGYSQALLAPIGTRGHPLVRPRGEGGVLITNWKYVVILFVPEIAVDRGTPVQMEPPPEWWDKLVLKVVVRMWGMLFGCGGVVQSPD